MIFHRLAVRHYKGIHALDIRFAPTGITLVEGRNEIGKSSLVQALTTLFDEPVTRTRAKLGHLIPKDGSGTPDITLEGETGPYRFSFRKRFIENKTVELRLAAPHDVFLTGKEAQERFEHILNETLDRTLWRALMLQQGVGVGLPEVEDQKALMTALDTAVSGPVSAPDGESLYARVEEEYGKYYHAGHGGELQTLRSLRERRDAADASVREHEERLRELERKIARARQLRQTLRTLDDRETVARNALRDAAERLTEVERLERVADAEQRNRDQTRETLAAARREHDARRRLAGLTEAADGELARVAGLAETATPAETAAEAVASEKKAALDRLLAEQERRERLARLRQNDDDYFRDAQELERLRQRRERAAAALARVAEAQRELAGNAVTESVVRDLRDAETAVAVAAARLEGAAPRLTLAALEACSVVIDGNAVGLAAGETREMPVPDATTLEIPGILRLAVTAGESGGVHARQVDDAKTRLAALLETHGLTSAADALPRLEKRRRAERVVADSQNAVAETPDGREYGDDADALAARILELETTLPRYLSSRPAEPPPPPDADAARRERDQAETMLAEAIARRTEAETAWTEADAARRAARDVRARLDAERGSAARERESLLRLLDGARQSAPDDQLELALARADAAAADAAATLAGVRDKLKALDADRVRERLSTCDAAVKKIDQERSAAREELARLGGELDHLGGDGLDERLEEARAEREHRSQALAAAERKAGAARLLHTVLSAARERAGRAYMLPLTRRIEDLARSVYDAEVRVTLTDDLRIASRAMHGMDIAFGELSGGAREQFSLIHRAACSLAVAAGGGVPLILDDALGYSDNARLLGMNEVLSRAARQCQIIILTCMPSRYAYLEPAERINLEELNPKPHTA